jgi:hypothetical protein
MTDLTEYPVSLNAFEIGLIIGMIERWEERNGKGGPTRILKAKLMKVPEQFGNVKERNQP